MLLTALLSWFLTPLKSFAAVEPIPGLQNVTNNIVDTITWAVGTLLVVLVIWFGVQFLINMDNPSGRAQVKNKAFWALIGLFIILSARPLSAWLSSLVSF